MPQDLRIEEMPDALLGPTEVRVRICIGGICGSDLHYYNHGGSGFIRLKEPMTLGHEVAGIISEVGPEISHLAIGERVAVNPSRHCGHCQYCQEGLTNHCLDMRFMGSAMRFPHVQGAFQESVVVDASQALPVADSVSMEEASMAEPLAVCLHAVGRAGSLVGKRVLIIGCGPIGNLVIVAARNAGAGEIVAIDIQNFALKLARRCGADCAINSAESPAAASEYVAARGKFDVVFEASGNSTALKAAIELLRPRGVVVQVGLGADLSVQTNIVVTREIEIRGTFRFTSEFALAVDPRPGGRETIGHRQGAIRGSALGV
jgi:L-idonate 5-dehydrogenase